MNSPQDLLSTNDCDIILENCLKRKNLKVASHTIESLSDKIEGFLGQHFFVTITYEDKNGALASKRCFMKVLNGASKLIFEISESLNAYNKEKFFYTFLLNEYDKYDIDTSFSPRGYFCKPHLLVLEDLSQRNFVGYPHGSSFLDIDHCKAGLTTLAKFHASGILYESAKSKEEGRPYHLAEEYPEMFQDMMFAKEDNLAREWFKHTVGGILDLIENISDKYNIKKEEFRSRLGQTLKDNEDLIGYLSKFKGTMLHGDLWFNNFMFKYGSGNIVRDAIVLDYQLLKYGPPSVDVLHFLYANTRKSFRDDHFDELVEFYYKELSSRFPQNGLCSLLSKDEYLQLCKELQVIIKLQCICDRSVTLLVDEQDAVTVSNDDALRRHLFDQRGERIVNCFNSNTTFREVIAEDMVELYNMLLRS